MFKQVWVMRMMVYKNSKTFQARIYIAGEYGEAKKICKQFCETGFCVSLSKVDYVYTFGEESGLEIKVINYPRFDRSIEKIKSKSMDLAINLLTGLSQGSLSIVYDDETLFMSRREQDLNSINKDNK